MYMYIDVKLGEIMFCPLGSRVESVLYIITTCQVIDEVKRILDSFGFYTLKAYKTWEHEHGMYAVDDIKKDSIS